MKDTAEMADLLYDVDTRAAQLSFAAKARVAALEHEADVAATAMVVIAIVAGAILSITIARAISKPISGAIAELRGGSQQVEAAAAQVSESSQLMAQAASEQASSLEESSASLEEMASMTRRNRDNVEEANSLMKTARGPRERGNPVHGRNVASDGRNQEFGR